MARILVAEDEPAVREFVSRALASDGHGVTAVTNGGQALDALAAGGAFELLLADIRMPVMDGVALALKVARDYPALPVLLMTGYAEEQARAHNLDRLIRGIVRKPFSLERICAAVNDALAPLP